MVLSMIVIPRRFPARVNIPNRSFWFADERRQLIIESLLRYGLSIALIVQRFILAIHGLMIQANQAGPLTLDSIGFTIAL